MDIKKIEELVKLIEKSTLMEFSIKDGDTKITMSKNAWGVPGQADGSVAVNTTPQVAEEAEEEECYITSPIVGTFYSASSPEAKSFVNVGDVVKVGQTVCILEAMKMLNEIESEFACEIEAVLVSNEQKVEYGQPLFRVKKLED